MLPLMLNINPVPVSKPAMHIYMCECPKSLESWLEKNILQQDLNKMIQQ
jgi:hypothetical protein